MRSGFRMRGQPVDPGSAGEGETAFHSERGREIMMAVIGRADATVHGNAYTFTIADPGDLVSSAVEAQIRTGAEYVIGLISRYIAWKGSMDFVVEIKPAAQSPYPSANGILPSVAQIGWNGTGWDNQTLAECRTGVDSDTGKPDAGCTIYLADDGTVRNYGAPVWFDPNPQFGVNPVVPSGAHDFVGIYTHEVFHALGFYAATDQWKAMIRKGDGVDRFTGATATALFGGQLPFLSETDHYGNKADPSVGITRGLMFQFGNYEGNRFDIGRIDLAVLADLGHNIKSYDGLSLFELVDSALDLEGSADADTLFGDYHANRLDGKAGNDTIHGGAGDDLILGGAGDDRLFGDAGADRIDGGFGREVLTGGDAADIFAFAIGDSQNYARRSDGHKIVPDLIADFVSGEDKIDLSAIDAIAGTAANDAFTFLGVGAFTGVAGQLRYEVAGGQAHIFADVNGDGGSDLSIVVNADVLLVADFVL
jgi:Ca2+-binding RTX toxin-like protein